MDTFGLEKRNLSAIELENIYKLKLDNSTQSKLILFFSLVIRPKEHLVYEVMILRFQKIALLITNLLLVGVLSGSMVLPVVGKILIKSTLPILVIYIPFMALGLLHSKISIKEEDPRVILSLPFILHCQKPAAWENMAETLLIVMCAVVFGWADQFSLMLSYAFFLFILRYRQEKYRKVLQNHIEKLDNATNIYEYYHNTLTKTKS